MKTSGTQGPDGTVLAIGGLDYSVAGRRLLNGLELELRAGESVAVTGPSGSGKSTLLSCVLGLIRPNGGTVAVAGADTTGLRGAALARHRSRHIGMVFQFGELLPELSPVDNVALAALLAGTAKDSAYRRAEELLDELEVPRADTSGELSGGERQRTAVARALINSPSLLLADEPTGALDAATRDKVTELLFAMPARHGCGLLLVTHDLTVATHAERVLSLDDGRLVPVPVRSPGAGDR
ncbi:ABC transporter ATP-binding protein [Streptomyces clavuligerus]|uniref:ABC-type antimicrobial peptide transport system, ATPase component n=1 Tax=Streptomyces clavuligerus TaxID=1901 RepID=E2Q155_STRCL|nr:ATP-binding cassette domain-containing protein [Streptomyces clavuligerus]ANW18764.1 ABC transporter ATP-binding protein [Streptomyces clavuligerus]AXU13330.1 ATP-binding cassette domain-containing protein [Streptomyces clavuligerus]EFG08560.1 ABC-type antimicrobial peptide transport system, ATPase component [Streptomyces clavuligerus]MBY6303285.1 ATP-binding cassette domain-containing protein [Streptomyces clavuligerus]QCS06113.1 ABC transporter ATP-binding protein [Streptomyces clavuliger